MKIKQKNLAWFGLLTLLLAMFPALLPAYDEIAVKDGRRT
jgi:hypothetical protein